jgi:hypothetical protein
MIGGGQARGRWSPKTKTENKHKVEVTGKPVWLPDNGRDG